MEVFHEMIYNNLCLLKENGHKISFEKGMFQHRNQSGFERVGYALLRVIDPTECQKNIPRPLFETTAKNDFRISFVKFIKMINEAHSDAQIPEMTASNLQHPGGEKFLRFMYKLSTFAIKLEIKRMMGSDQEKLLISYPDSSNLKSSKENSIKLNIMRGARCQAEYSTGQYSKLDAAAIPKMQLLKKINNHLASEVNTARIKLESEILKLPTSVEYSKERLRNIEDQNVLSEWSCRTKEKIKELEETCQNLSRVRQLVAKSCELVKAMDKTHSETLCLDGSLLLIPQAVSELAGSPVMNTQGQVRLEVLLKAGVEAVRRRAPSPHPPPQSSLLPLAHNLLTDVRHQRESATYITQCLLNLIAESKEAIKKQIPVISAKMKEIEVADHLKYLKNKPALQFICDEPVSKISSPLESRKRMSFNSMANLHLEKGRKIVCSVRKRRSVSKYSFEQTPRQLMSAPRFAFKVPLTCVSHKSNVIMSSLKRPSSRKSIAASTTSKDMLRNQKVEPVINPEMTKSKQISKIPTCKRSIYGKLPTGARQEPQEDFAELSTDDSLLNCGSSKSFSETSIVNGSQTCSTLGDDNSNTEQFEAASPPKKPRKSLLDLMERYEKIRASMKPITSKNKQ